MKGITYAVTKNRRITIFAIIVALVLGVYSYMNLPRQESPDVSAPAARVIITYPGAAPEKVESQITKKLEEAFAEVDDYDMMETHSIDGASIGIIMLKDGADTKEAWDQLNEEIDNIKNDLPDEVYSVEVDTEISTTAGIVLSVSGESYSNAELIDYASFISRELEEINGVMNIDVEGEVQKEIEVNVDMNLLGKYMFSLKDISNIIKSQNTEIPTGKINTDGNTIQVKSEGSFDTISDIENIILMVSPQTGSLLRLKDIASIKMIEKDDNVIYRFNGKDTVILNGYFVETLNVVKTGETVMKELERLSGELPNDLKIEYVVNNPMEVKKSINDFIINLIQAVVFVIIVIFIGMGAKNAAVVAMTIPLSICITLSMMYLFGIKLEQMSISALIIALGMLVDNAIVVSDSIQHHIDNKMDKLEACVKGTSEVSMSILTSTLTTVFAFMPLMLINSAVGEYIFGVPSVVIIALLASYLCALVSTPLMAYYFFEPVKEDKKKPASKIKLIFEKLLAKTLKNKSVLILGLIIALALTGGLTSLLDISMFPKADKNFIYIDLDTENTVSFNNTKELVALVTNVVKEQPEVLNYMEVVGGGLPRFYLSVENKPKSSDVGQILIEIDTEKGGRFETRLEFVEYLQSEIDKKVVGGTGIIKMLDVGAGSGYPIKFRVLADDLEYLEEMSSIVESELSDIAGVKNVLNSFSPKEYKYYVDVNENLSGGFGITKFDIQQSISNTLIGAKSSSYRKHDNEYDIVVKGDVNSTEELKNTSIKSPISSQKILIKDLADISIIPEYPNIQRFNQKRASVIRADLADGIDAADIEKEIIRRVNELNLENIEITFDGEATLIEESFSKLGLLAVFALLLILAVLILQFNSYIQPAIILLSVPLSFIGAIIALFLSGSELSFTAMLGMVSLMGIVVNNAIVLIDYINSEKAMGKNVAESCIAAVDRRFKPIMLGTITTIIGLVPLVISGGETFRPMAIALMGGLAVSTVLTLVVIPSFYNMILGSK